MKLKNQKGQKNAIFEGPETIFFLAFEFTPQGLGGHLSPPRPKQWSIGAPRFFSEIFMKLWVSDGSQTGPRPYPYGSQKGPNGVPYRSKIGSNNRQIWTKIGSIIGHINAV